MRPIRPYLRATIPRREQYIVVATGGPPSMYELPPDLDFETVRPEHLGVIEASRPGHGSLAQRLLSDGHEGSALFRDNQMLAIQWNFQNRTSRTVKAMYFPVLPGEVWLHHGWVHPSTRGMALLRRNCEYDMTALAQRDPIPRSVVADILPSNVAALRSVEHVGMLPSGTMEALLWIRYTWAKRLDDTGHRIG